MAKQDTVLIVGGGVVGLACAHYLTKAGFQVTVIDKGGIGAACSHGNCGYVCPSHVLPLTEPEAIEVALKSLFKPNAPFRVKPRFDPSLIHWMLQFARRCRKDAMLDAAAHLRSILDSSMVEFRQLVEGEGLACQWQAQGLLYVFRSETSMAGFAKTDSLLREKFDLGAERLEGVSLSDFDGALRSDLAGAFHYSGDTHLRPDLLLRNWVVRLREQGVELLPECELQRVLRDGDRVLALQTNRGELMADHYVFAMGAWSGRLGRELSCRIPVEPGKGYSVTMKRPSPCPTHPILFPEHKVGVTPFDDGYRIGSMMEFAGFDESIDPKRIEQLHRSVEPYLVAPYTEASEETWYGWRPMTWDSLPIIGHVPALKNAILATGHNMLGLTLAPGTGRLVAELMTGVEPHIDVTGFDPARFV